MALSVQQVETRGGLIATNRTTVKRMRFPLLRFVLPRGIPAIKRTRFPVRCCFRVLARSDRAFLFARLEFAVGFRARQISACFLAHLARGRIVIRRLVAFLRAFRFRRIPCDAVDARRGESRDVPASIVHLRPHFAHLQTRPKGVIAAFAVGARVVLSRLRPAK